VRRWCVSPARPCAGSRAPPVGSAAAAPASAPLPRVLRGLRSLSAAPPAAGRSASASPCSSLVAPLAAAPLASLRGLPSPRLPSLLPPWGGAASLRVPLRGPLVAAVAAAPRPARETKDGKRPLRGIVVQVTVATELDGGRGCSSSISKPHSPCFFAPSEGLVNQLIVVVYQVQERCFNSVMLQSFL